MKGDSKTFLVFLPKTVAPTDFIFSVIAEETGFVGSVVLILVFGLIVFSGFYIATKASDSFGRKSSLWNIYIAMRAHVC